MAKNQSLQAVAQLRSEMIEREIALKREMFEKEIQAEKDRLAEERKRFEEEKAKIQSEYEMTNQGLAGVLKGIASVGNEILGKGSIFGNNSKLNDASPQIKPRNKQYTGARHRF